MIPCAQKLSYINVTLLVDKICLLAFALSKLCSKQDYPSHGNKS